jgi:hypothetical protein
MSLINDVMSLINEVFYSTHTRHKPVVAK